jgi:trehalose 6-phosphate synthase/phosphatase
MDKDKFTKFDSVIVSNRLPISVSKEEGVLKYSKSSGGLATAMSSLDSKGRVWVGWPGISSDELSKEDKNKITDELLKQGCYPVFLTDEEVKLYYEGYSNDTLWPLFHYFQSLTEHNEEYWDAYQEVNNLFAKVVKKVSKDEATIWVHDYQLMLVPGLLRKNLPKSLIGFFLHIPFPSYEIFRQLPNRKEIMQGLLGADLLGFHIYDYARHFLSSAVRIEAVEHTHGLMNYKGRTLVADTFPIGIDYEKFAGLLEDNKVKDEIKLINENYQNQKIIVSVDRLDYTKGILQRLEAFELLLEDHPELHRKISLVMIAVPSRTGVETYKTLRDNIELSISRINGQYATVDWTPISYRFKNQPQEKVVALYAAADIALVTPLRDGMNLVAKEYLAAHEKNSGVLILSEMAGAIDELPESLSINPNSIRSIKDAILKALEMPEDEQRERMKIMQNRLKSYSVIDWATDFNEQLEALKSDFKSGQDKLLSSEMCHMIKKTYDNSDEKLLIFDYDGTLRDFVNSTKPELARPSSMLLDNLEKLSQDEKTTICIVSGRSKEALDMWFRGMNVSLVAEHGAQIKINGEWHKQETSFENYREDLAEILRKYAKRTAGAMVEEKTNSIVWHYRKVTPELAYARNSNLTQELERIIRNTDIKIHHGNKIIEIKPESTNKGVVVEELVDKMLPDFILAIGDDYTDEDMFRVLPEQAFTINVGQGESEALFQLKDVEAVHEFIELLANDSSH